MVAYKTVGFLVQGIFGLGFTFIVLSFFVQRYEEVVFPTLMGIGISSLGAQMFDIVNYGVEWLLPLGVICIIVSLIIWAANWG